jgi:hypothetical protein
MTEHITPAQCCPFCPYVAPAANQSGSTRRHVKLKHTLRDVINRPIPSRDHRRYRPLGPEHPNLIVSLYSEEPDRTTRFRNNHTNMAYCFKCFHVIKLPNLSTRAGITVESLLDVARSHECKEKQQRKAPSRGSSDGGTPVAPPCPSETTSLDWKSVLEIMSQKRPAFKKEVDETIALIEDEEDDTDWEWVATNAFKSIHASLCAAEIALKNQAQVLIKAREEAAASARESVIESYEGQIARLMKSHEDQVARMKAVIDDQKRQLDYRPEVAEMGCQTD